MDIQGRIDGLLSQVTVRQTFVNALDEPLEATYIFPLPDRAAVRGFRMEVAGRIIEGVLEEREKAREEYDQAIAAGHRAAIAEEERPGVFTLRVGNLMPGEEATVQLALGRGLALRRRRGHVPVPAGRRASVHPGHPACPVPRWATARPSTPTPCPTPRGSRRRCCLPGFPNPVRLVLDVELYDHDGCISVDDLRSQPARGPRRAESEGFRRVRLQPGERLDRDFILRFRLAATRRRHPVDADLAPRRPDGRAGTFALTLVPPVEAAAARSGRATSCSCSTAPGAWRAGRSWRPAGRWPA